jgi:hypothetical protein
MKFFVSLLLIAMLSFAACLFLPWWAIAIAAFLVTALIRQSPVYAFLAGFLSIFLLWSIMALLISYNNDDILAHKVSQLIIQMDNPLLLVLVTGLLGGIVAGLAALAGSFVRKRYPDHTVVEEQV